MSVDNQALRSAVRLTLMTSAIGAIAAPVNAQDSDVAEVIVTGSRIVRPDYQSASPIVTVSEANFRETGSTTVETMLNTLPQFVPSVTNTSNNPSNNGQANMELRGLGIERTLVLLDGKRIVPSDDSGAVDLNIIPASLISNVEIISGGASAAYGSDAIAGVVNIKTKDFEGLQFDGNWGQTTESDGEEWQVGITGGLSFAEGRGKAMLNVAYAERDAVLAADRDFAQVALGYVNQEIGFIPQGSGTIEEGSVSVAASQAAKDQVFAQYGVPPGSVLTNTFAFNDDGTLFTTGDGETPSVFNYRGNRTDVSDLVYTYNFSPTNYLQLPLERTTAFGRISFEVTPAAELYAQGIYADYEADTQLAPSPASQMFISPTNPFIPPDLATLLASRSDPTAPISMGKRVSELGPRFENNSYEVYQILGGVRGELFGSNWNYDVYASYGEVNLDNTQLGSVSRTRFEELTFAPDGGA
ncbi:MAG: TonB-dependent receptor plug domain-containing protein, partial [Xanthomonadaceae bacterium]|nr:TonB-dependent receptor plug domain-containing protein [Xanthomonadaceae bacterium]